MTRDGKRTKRPSTAEKRRRKADKTGKPLTDRSAEGRKQQGVKEKARNEHLDKQHRVAEAEQRWFEFKDGQTTDNAGAWTLVGDQLVENVGADQSGTRPGGRMHE